ncbi:MAG: DUF535 domain-containing protein [Chitinophagaceae bacterium]|nr:MAG: DUF535 domain-containing protein [Chitinophagaceae bacterium]
MFSAATKAWKLATNAFSKESKEYRRKQQYKSFRYALIHPFFASQWFKIFCSPEFHLIAEHRSRLYIKPFRVYMSVYWDRDRRVKVILDTYRFIQSAGEGFLQVIASEEPMPLAVFRLKDGSEARLSIGYDERYRKEGELAMFLHCGQPGGFIAGASFSFENTAKEGWVCRIGCIQGHKNGEEDLIKSAQNLMNGLRPKSFMVFAVMEFARHSGIQRVYGAGQSIQAFRRQHAIHIPWFHKIHFDYNKLWTESGGKLQEDGWFLLPCTTPRKSMDEIKACKRAVYRRRYQMMDEISGEISKSVQLFNASVREELQYNSCNTDPCEDSLSGNP